MNYCPLNIYSGYTFLSSALKIEDIFSVCKKNNYPYFGICDFNNMYSYSAIVKECKNSNIKPLFGSTIIYLVDEQHPLEISLYIYNEQGYKNLSKIISLYPNGINNQEFNLLKDGLICVLPSSNIVIHSLLEEHNLIHLKDLIEEIKTNFNHFYIGIELYHENDQYFIDLLREFIKENNYSPVAFNKHLYQKKEDAISLSILKAIKNNLILEKKEEEGPYFFLNEQALNHLYTLEEINNTLSIASLANEFNFLIKRGKLLSLSLPNKKEVLFNKCLDKLNTLNVDREKYISRINYELSIIEKMNYLDYFLIVQDYVQNAKENNIKVGPGRGSAAGSLVSYLLSITEIDSLKYNLLFERFLNPERVSLPDIDIDFEDTRRNEVINYIQEKYTHERTCLITTFQTMQAKNALRDIGRIFQINQNDINTLCKKVSHQKTLTQAYKENEEFRILLEDDYFLNIVKLAKKIEGLPRQTGIHAAGIIINNDSLISTIPVNIIDNTLYSQFDATLLENLGFLKMDILSLNTLSLIKDIELSIKQEKPNFSLEEISFEDENTFSILNKGLTSEIFQLESEGITKALKQVKVNSYDDIVAILALYRPGPLENIPVYAKNKNQNHKINYLHPLLEEILSPTYGVIIYQEQIMQIVQKCALFTLSEADLFRKAISKKDASTLVKLRKDFINGCLKNNIEESKANQIFELIYKFANYGFNKSHTVSYALLSYQMAFLKANYPKHFYKIILNTLSLQDKKTTFIINELNYFNLKLNLPDFNISKNQYVYSNNNLYIPLSSIKGISKDYLQIVNEIQTKQITNFATFMKYASSLPNEVIYSLIDSGSFDYLNQTRQTLRKSVQTYRLFYQNVSNADELDKDELEMLLPIIKQEEDNKKENYEKEFEALGILLSGSLFVNYQKQIANIIPLYKQLSNLTYNKTKIVVNIQKIKRILTKNNEGMALITGQDDTSLVNIVMFPKIYVKYTSLIQENKIVIIDGYFKNKDDEISFISEDFKILEEDK